MLTELFFVVFALAQSTQNSIGGLMSNKLPFHFEVVRSDRAIYRGGVNEMDLLDIWEEAHHILGVFLKFNK